MLLLGPAGFEPEVTVLLVVFVLLFALLVELLLLLFLLFTVVVVVEGSPLEVLGDCWVLSAPGAPPVPLCRRIVVGGLAPPPPIPGPVALLLLPGGPPG